MFFELYNSDSILNYSVIGSGPVVLLTGAPLGIEGFSGLAAALSSYFTVVRHDPRGVGRSPLRPGASLSIDILMEDVRAILSEITDEPSLVFGASGGAVVGLHLLSRYPSAVQRLVVHEPPMFGLLDDQGHTLALADEAFQIAGDNPPAGFQAFSELTEILHETHLVAPRPPRIILPPLSMEEQEKQRYALNRMAPVTTHYEPDLEGIPKEKLIVAAGEASVGQPARKAAEALASGLGIKLVEAPGNHLGMMRRSYEFSTWLKECLFGELP